MEDLTRRKFIALGGAVAAVAVGGGAYAAFGGLGGTAQNSGGSTSVTNGAAKDAAVNSTSPDNDGLLLLEGGTFQMGSPDDVALRGTDEVLHAVTLSPFYIAPYEVTQKSYQQVMGKNPSENQGDEHPVENVSWLDAIEYCNALSAQAGLTPAYSIDGNQVTWNRGADGYRLLTEAEWEYAAKAGGDKLFGAKDQIVSDDANFEGVYPYLIERNYVVKRDDTCVTSTSRGQTLPVGSLPANAFGLFDMLGNVSEWCFDIYEPNLSAATNPVGPSQGSLRLTKGGSYNDFGKHLRCAYRAPLNPRITDGNLGFRIARNATSNESSVTTQTTAPFTMPSNAKVLVPYFSYSGNTRAAAEIVARLTGGTLVEINMEQPYSGDIYETSQADLFANARPAITTTVDNIGSYDVVLLGYPTWWATAPMPVFSFFEKFDLTNKLVAVFSSNGGTHFGKSLSDVGKALPQSSMGYGLQFYYSGGTSLTDDIRAWLDKNGVAHS